MTSARCVRKAVVRFGGVESVEGECWTCWSSVAMDADGGVCGSQGSCALRDCMFLRLTAPSTDDDCLHQHHGRGSSCIYIALSVARPQHSF